MTDPIEVRPIELKIEKLVYGGEGLGHSQGHTVFVPFVLPDETVSVDPVEQHKKFIRGRVARVVEASPLRMSAPCPHFGICGGCNYQHMPYTAQLHFKANILRETLSRLGRIRRPAKESKGSPLAFQTLPKSDAPHQDCGDVAIATKSVIGIQCCPTISRIVATEYGNCSGSLNR